MSAPDEYGRSYTDPVTGWVGWVIFAAVFMIVIGTMNAIQGLAALFRDEDYWVRLQGGTEGTDPAIVTFNVTSWGWIHLILGILPVLVGLALMRGSTFARVIGIALVSLNLIAQFAWTSLYPFWGLIAIAVDILIIYALVVHGRELQPT